MESGELYVTDAYNKNVRHKLVFDEIIVVKSFADSRSAVYAIGDRVVHLNNSISSVFDFYFRKQPTFIHASEHHIINTKHIITAEANIYDGALKINLTNNHVATLRRTHQYAYFIINGEPRKKKPLVENCQIKDDIIMSEIKNTRDIVDEIFRATGQRVTSRWVVKRWKQLKINS